MKLVTVDTPDGLQAGLLLGKDVLKFRPASRILPLAKLIPNDVAEILATGPRGVSIMSEIVEKVEGHKGTQDTLRLIGALVAATDIRLAAPIPKPSIIICAGQTFGEHVREMAKRRGVENPMMPTQPRGFLKNPNAVIGPGEPIVLPREFPDKIDYEGEFAVVFGRPCHNVSIQEAMDYVAGYTIVNDVSARNWSGQESRDQTLLGKQFPTFCPLGPAVTTKDEIPEPDKVRLVTRLNGQVMQSATMDDLIFSVAEIIAHYAKYYRFAPGDVVTMGTPSGAGHGRTPPIYMKPGDWIEVDVEGIGQLTNPIVAFENQPDLHAF